MCFKKKNKMSEKVLKDREKIYSNSKFIDSVLARYDGKEEYIEQLKDIQEQLKYLRPSHKDEIFDYEKAIEKRLMEINRILSDDIDKDREVKDFISDMKALIADRNIYV